MPPSRVSARSGRIAVGPDALLEGAPELRRVRLAHDVVALVVERGVQEEPVVLELEVLVLLADPALAQGEELLAFGERADGDRPFLQGNWHRGFPAGEGTTRNNPRPSRSGDRRGGGMCPFCQKDRRRPKLRCKSAGSEGRNRPFRGSSDAGTAQFEPESGVLTRRHVQERRHERSLCAESHTAEAVARRRRSAERGEAGAALGGREVQLDGDADVELAEGAAGDAVLGEEVLEVEAADQRVAFQAAVGDVAAGDAGALAVAQLADAAAGQDAGCRARRRGSRRSPRAG